MTRGIELEGKAALVTGAGRRVGAAIARALGGQGMRVAVHYHSAREGAEATCEAVAAAGGQAFPIGANLRDRDACRSLIDEAVARFGGLDLLVPSAAGFERVAFDDVDDQAWDRMMCLNLDGPFALVHAARDALRASHGAIVFITDTSATVPFRHYLPYVVSKGALRALMRVLALELAPHVRVNAVAPGTVLPPEGLDAASLEELVARIPLARIGRPEDVADAVVHLARAPLMTGHELVVDGGHSVAG